MKFKLTVSQRRTLDRVYRVIRPHFSASASIDEIESTARLISERNNWRLRPSVADARRPIMLRGIARW